MLISFLLCSSNCERSSGYDKDVTLSESVDCSDFFDPAADLFSNDFNLWLNFFDEEPFQDSNKQTKISLRVHLLLVDDVIFFKIMEREGCNLLIVKKANTRENNTNSFSVTVSILDDITNYEIREALEELVSLPCSGNMPRVLGSVATYLFEYKESKCEAQTLMRLMGEREKEHLKRKYPNDYRFWELQNEIIAKLRKIAGL